MLSGKLIPKIASLKSWLDCHSEHTVLVTSKWFALVCVVSRPIVNLSYLVFWDRYHWSQVTVTLKMS